MPNTAASRKIPALIESPRSQSTRPSRPCKVDRKLLEAVAQLPADKLVAVTMKLRRDGAKFAQLPMSNDPGNTRARTFAGEIDALMTSAGDRDGAVRVVQRAANLGIATVEAPASLVKHLLESALAKLETLDLARGGTSSWS